MQLCKLICEFVKVNSPDNRQDGVRMEAKPGRRQYILHISTQFIDLDDQVSCFYSNN